MLNLNNTLDGYLKNVEVIGNTVQDTNNLADIRSVGDKVEGQELYKIDVVSCGKNLFDANVCVDGYLLSGTKGEANTNASWFYSDYIRVKAGVTYRMGAYKKPFDPFYSCLYNEDKVFIKSNIGEVFTPSCDGYVRLSGIIEQKHVGQLEINSSITPYEPYQEDKLEILSPVQLEKVGDVADRIICKDGVWGVEKNIATIILNESNNWVLSTNEGDNTIRFKCTINSSISNKKDYLPILSNKFKSNITTSSDIEGIQLWGETKELQVRINNSRLSTQDVQGFKTWIKDNNIKIKYPTTQPQFIPLPHDQQVKLRTFAEQTNIAFLTEIPGQIKAQVPKSLGATVNTHTEQIKDLHNSLDRVKKLEETTVSTVETESSFTTVDATSNGYFEDVKLEGKTLVNLVNYSNNLSNIGSSVCTSTKDSQYYKFEVTKVGSLFSYIKTINDMSSKDITLIIHIKSGFIPSLYKKEGFQFIKNLDSGLNVITVNTANLASGFGIGTLGNAVEGTILEYSIVILEGDHTNNPPSYFEGLMSVGQDVEEFSVESVSSGNLLDLSRIVVGKYIANNNKDTEHATSFYCDKYVKVYPGVKYQLIASDDSKQRGRVSCYGKSGNYISTTEYATNMPIYFDSTVDTIRLSFFDRLHLKDMLYFGTNSNYIGQVIKPNKKPLLYYNPTTETWEKPVLREWDTIEKHSDGKYYYHKRSGEVVLNGSEGWVLDKSFDNTCGFYLQNFGITTNYVICKDFKYGTQSDFGSKDEECVSCNNNAIKLRVLSSKLPTQDVAGFKAWLKANPTTVVYQLAKEEVYECTNIDLMTYSGETNYIINSGAISPKSLLKVHNNISNVVKILQEKVSLLENTFIAGLKSVLSGDMYSLATILYPEDFEQNDNTEQDIMVIPE